MVLEDESTAGDSPVGKQAAGTRLSRDELVPSPGDVVAGKYRIEGLLGRGGMGVVAHGRQLELDRSVAIKFLQPALATDARPLQRFAREARLVAQMRSEHVVRVFDVGRENGVPYIVMEHLTGHDLAREIARGPLSVERAVELVLHACEALGEAHSLGIVHRDVKPSNLFLTKSFGGRESLKVLDFGISKWLMPASELEALAMTTDGAAVGTPAFASPEQLTQPDSIDGRADVWALGVVLYQALTGALPFKGDTIPALYSQIIGGTPLPFPVGHDLPEGLTTCILRCLERDPKNRYPRMLDLARALAPFAPARASEIVHTLSTLPLEAEKPDAAASPSEAQAASGLSTTLEFSQITPQIAAVTQPSDRPARRRTALVALSLALVLGVALGFLLRREPPVANPEPKVTGSLSGAEAPPVLATPSSEAPPLPPVEPAVAPTRPPPPLPAPQNKGKRRVAGAPTPREPATSSVAAPPPPAPASASAPSPTPSAQAHDRLDAVPLYRH